MAAGLLIMPQRMPARDRNGRATTGAIRVYANQTTTPVTVYTSAALNVAHSQPITSDDAGVFPEIWRDTADASVTMAYQGADGQTESIDDITPSSAAAAALINAYAGAASFLFSTTATDADPGAGYIRYSSGTLASVGYLYVDNAAYGGTDVTAYLDSFDDANLTSNRGVVALRSTADVATFTLFRVTGSVVDGTGYRKIPVAYLSGVLPADGDTLVMGFAAAGPSSAATVTAGTATALASTASPTVANSGNTSNAVFDFGIPGAAAAGVPYTFSTTTTDADPGAGNLRFNNATVASVTSLFFDDLDAGGNSQTTWLDAFDDSTNTTIKGQLTIRQARSYKNAVFNVTGSVTNGTGYRKVAVTYVSGVLPDNGSEVGVVFAVAGDKGANGTMTGPGTSTNNAVALWNGTGGTTLKDSGFLIGTSANNLVQLTAASKLPAVDGSLLTNLPQPGMTLISVVTASTSTTVDVETTFDSTYDEYLILAENIVLSTAGSISARMKLGGIYQTGTYATNVLTRVVNSTTQSVSTSATTLVPVISGLGNNPAYAGSLEMYVPGAATSAVYKQIRARGLGFDGSLTTLTDAFAQNIAGAGALTGIRFFPDSGTINSGTFRLYGFKKS